MGGKKLSDRNDPMSTVACPQNGTAVLQGLTALPRCGALDRQSTAAGVGVGLVPGALVMDHAGTTTDPC